MKQNANVSKAIRTLGLRLMPGDLVDEAMTMVRATMAASDYQDPDGAKNKLFDAFSEIGVAATDLAGWLGHKGSSLTPKELADLRAIYRGIKDGETTWREVMGQKEGKPEETREPIGKGAKGLDDAISAKESKPTQELTAQQVHDAMSGATSKAELEEAIKAMKKLPKKDAEALQGLAIAMLAKFE
jgi:hypothetical protein